MTTVELERTQLDPALDEVGAELGAEDRPWLTLVWNDPVNLMSYVTYIFQKLFGYSQEEATKLMLDVHHQGRAVVTRGSRDKVEVDVAKLHAAGLWATMQRDA
jgi:ATP-dependent Clp protease adaptor protein ClpS